MTTATNNEIIPTKLYTAAEAYFILYGEEAPNQITLKNRMTYLRNTKSLKCVTYLKPFKYLGKSLISFINENID